jgi:hypothetical protein
MSNSKKRRRKTMKITVEFDTVDEARHALAGQYYHFAIEEFRNKLRNIRKHGVQPDADPERVISYVENEFYAAFEGLLAD